jgi:FixJ family two-component response regulator
MPGLRGTALAVQLKETRPGIEVVFISGSGGDAVDPGGESGVAGEFLPKPFGMEALARAVGRAVARAANLEGRTRPEA